MPKSKKQLEHTHTYISIIEKEIKFTTLQDSETEKMEESMDFRSNSVIEQ